MIYGSVIFFTLGALLGALMLFNYVLKKRHIPKGLALIHGPLVVIGLVLLITHNIQRPEQQNWLSVGLFVSAALLGLYVFIQDMIHQKVMMNVLIFHILLAVIGYLNLLLRLF